MCAAEEVLLLVGLWMLVACGGSDAPAGEVVRTEAAVEPSAEIVEEPPTSEVSAVDGGLPDPASFPVTPTGLDNGVLAPELVLPDLMNGGTFRLSDHVGPRATSSAKVALVSFSASWCGPCKASLPHFKQLEEQYGDDLLIVIVTTDKQKAGQTKELMFARSAGLVDVPVLAPTETEINAYLGQRRNVPHFYIINKAGEILVQDRGYGDKVKGILPKQLAYAFKHPEWVER